MPTIAKKVEGYKIIAEDWSGKGSLGSNGLEWSRPAFSKEDAEAFAAELKVTYALQLIQDARFVRTASGEIVDNFLL